MERKIGEIFEYNSEWYQCVECDSCGECSLRTTECRNGTKSDIADEIFGECSKVRRPDNKHTIFKKLEKVGEPYIEHDHSMNKDVVVQDYKLYNQHACYNGHEEILCFGLFDKDGIVTIKSKEPIKSLNCKNSVEIEIKQNKEDMEGKTNLYEKQTPLQKLMEIYCDGRMDYNEFEKKVKELYSDKGDDSKPNLKPFDLEEAKAGKPVCTRDGRRARIICFDKKCLDEQVLIVLVDCGKEECMYFYTTDGKCIDDFSSFDLMMLPEKKEGWVNVYDADTTFRFVEGMVYNTKDEAIQRAKEEVINGQREKNEYVDTVKICWEE